MASAVRVIVYNTDESYTIELRQALLSFGGVKIVAEVDELALLPQVAEQFPADAVVIHLDPNPEPVLAIAAQVVAQASDLAVMAVSASTDGQLILTAMRSGLREFLTKPIDRNMLYTALAKLSERRQQAATQGRLICVLSAAGGVGVTTLTANLAVELAEIASGDVVAVDLDFRFGQLATILDVETTYTISDLASSHEQLEPQVLERALVKHRSGVKVLARPATFSETESISAGGGGGGGPIAWGFCLG